MNLEERIQEQEEAQRYLENKNIYEIMQTMIEDLLVAQPEDPLGFMISHLGQPSKKIVLLIGPPGLHLYKIAQATLSQNQKQQYVAFNSGQFVSSNKSALPAEAQKHFASLRLIPDQLIKDRILQQAVNFCKNNSHSLIQGFPKTLSQAIAFQKKGGIPDKVIFVNVDKAKLKQICVAKVLQHTPNLNPQEVDDLSERAATQYQLNLKDLKKYYPSYVQINATFYNEKQIGHSISKCLGLNFGQLQPRKNTRIVVVGAPFSGRTTLGKKIAHKYNLIYVSTAVLISEEIRRETVIGRKIKEKYAANELIDNFTIQKLLEQRITKKDCEMQGYVLEGYPKNKEQLDNLKSLHISPNFIIGLCPSERHITFRTGLRQSSDFSRKYAKWLEFEKALQQEKGIFWVNPQFDIENSFEEVCFEIENRKL